MKTLNHYFTVIIVMDDFSADLRSQFLTVQFQTATPANERAQTMKNEIKDAENLKFKLESKEGDILELRKAMKLKVSPPFMQPK